MTQLGTQPGNPQLNPPQEDRGPQPAVAGSSVAGVQDWIARWQRAARRIRVPLGFLTAALYLFELWRRAPQPAAVAWSLALVLPGLALRGYAAGCVKKNCELTVTGPYAHTRNPLYLGSMLIAAGFALALLSWPVALVLAAGFCVIYVPVIALEERFLRAAFPEFEQYCRRVPRLIPRLTPTPNPRSESAHGSFSFALYLKHREYNAVLGAALLYLSLLFLRPALGALLNGMR
ncbi:MAG: methyltransferase family protein [Terracidiphilus sp.]